MDKSFILQTPLNQQVQLNESNQQITIKGTGYIQYETDELNIIPLEGVTIVSTNSQIFTINLGEMLTINQQENNISIQPFDLSTLIDLPLDKLERSITISNDESSEALTTLTPFCNTPEDWIYTYAAQSGDSLIKIANQLDISPDELQSANCINNPNSIILGQVLKLPKPLNSSVSPAITFTPSVVYFRSDDETIIKGSCTTLRWDVQNIKAIELNDELVTDLSTQVICPISTTTYELVIYYFDDRQTQRYLTIVVKES